MIPGKHSFINWKNKLMYLFVLTQSFLSWRSVSAHLDMPSRLPPLKCSSQSLWPWKLQVSYSHSVALAGGTYSSNIQNQAFITAYAIENDLFLYSAQWTKIIYFTAKNYVGDHLLCLFCFQTDKRQVWWMTHGCHKKLLTRTILLFPTPELHYVSDNTASPHTFKGKLPYIFPKNPLPL